MNMQHNDDSVWDIMFNPRGEILGECELSAPDIEQCVAVLRWIFASPFGFGVLKVTLNNRPFCEPLPGERNDLDYVSVEGCDDKAWMVKWALQGCFAQKFLPTRELALEETILLVNTGFSKIAVWPPGFHAPM